MAGAWLPWLHARQGLTSGLLLLGGVFVEQQVQLLGVWPAKVSFSTADGHRRRLSGPLPSGSFAPKYPMPPGERLSQ